jgi:hypothetical protein
MITKIFHRITANSMMTNMPRQAKNVVKQRNQYGTGMPDTYAAGERISSNTRMREAVSDAMNDPIPVGSRTVNAMCMWRRTLCNASLDMASKACSSGDHDRANFVSKRLKSCREETIKETGSFVTSGLPQPIR